MFEDLPIFAINVKIWIRFGFICIKDYRRPVLILIVPILVNFFEMLNIYKMWGNIEVIVMGLFMTTIIFNSIVRTIILMVKETKFITFMKNMEDLYIRAVSTNDRKALEIFHKLSKRANVITKLSLSFGTIGAMLTASMPMLTNKRELPLALWIPGLDIKQSPLHEIIYALEAFVVIPFIMVTYVPFSNLLICWLIFGIAMLQDLRFKLESLKRQNFATEKEYLAALKGYIEYHKCIISYKFRLEELVSYVLLLEFVLFKVMLCVLLFFISMVDNFILQLTATIYIFSILYAILLTYWHANQFSCESLKIAEAAYGIEWISGSRELKKCVLTLIARSQNTLLINAGGIHQMNLETFQALLNASYSYFTLLRGLSD